MDRQVLLKGGPCDGETAVISENAEYARVAKAPDMSGIILTDENSTAACDAVVSSFGYRRSKINDNIFEFDGE